VLAFSLGFGPKLVKVTRGDTEYCISAIPLGGYVKLAGETAEDTVSGDPTEFLSKSKWVRVQVYLAGPAMNIGLAFLLTTVVLSQGASIPKYRSSPPVIGAVEAGGPGERAGLQPGDRVLRVDGTEVATWDDFQIAVIPQADRQMTLAVDREGEVIDVTVTPDGGGAFNAGDLKVLPVYRPQVTMVLPDQPAEKAGLKVDDVLLAVGGERQLTQAQVISKIQGSADVPLTFTVERAGEVLDLDIVPQKSGSVGLIGVQIALWESTRVDPDLLTALRMSSTETWQGAQIITTTLAGLFTRETPVDNLVGPVGIARMSGETAQMGWIPLLALMSMISLNLGILNLMPIPILDGGHITIIALEGLARRDFSMRVKERILLAGFALILMLMVTVVFNDFVRLFK
jgi:regulator of sigma E protease